MTLFSTSFSSSFSSEPPVSGSLLIPIMGAGGNSAPVYLSLFVMEDSRKPSNRVSAEYYKKPWLTKSEVLQYLGYSATTLERLSIEYPFIKTKIPKTGCILFSREELDKIIRRYYD
jgi:hypothetical protein